MQFRSIETRWWLAAVLVAALLPIAPSSFAQSWPERAIQVIVPYPPGPVDAKIRIVLDKVSRILGQPMVALNRPGAGMRLGTEQLLRAPADGYTIGVLTTTNAWLVPTLDPAARYDALRDLTLITNVYEAPMVLAVRPGLGVDSVEGLVKLAKASPGRLNYGAPQGSSSYRVWFEVFKGVAGLDIQYIGYKGLAAAVQDTVSGQIDAVLGDLGSVPLIQAGKLVALATTGERRMDVLPQVPTLREVGVNLVAGAWQGFAAPAGLPPEVERRLVQAFTEAVRDADVRGALERSGGTMLEPGPAALRSRIEAEMKLFRESVPAGTIAFE